MKEKKQQHISFQRLEFPLEPERNKMKTKMSNRSVDNNFYDYLQAAAAQKKYVQIHYFTALHELLKEMTVVKDTFMQGDEEYIVLASGKKVKLSQIVRIDKLPAPGHDDEDYYSCEC